MPDQSCSICHYWRQGGYRLGDGVPVGACRRSPPTIIDLSASVEDQRSADPEAITFSATHFPTLAADDWCGEFEERPAVTRAHLAELDTAETLRSLYEGFAKAHSPQGYTAGVGHLSHDDDAAW